MKKRSLIIELAGPAGAGKSTLTKALKHSGDNIRIGGVPNIYHIRDSIFFLWNTIVLLPIFFMIYCQKNGGSFTQRQIMNMVVLEGWHHRLKMMRSKDRDIIILDQSPIHMLADLLRFGPSNLRQVVPQWWNSTCHHWARTLSMVVCLDAPDPVLLNRIRTRQKDHGCKNETDDKAVQILSLSRSTLEQALLSVQTNSTGPKVVSFNTAQISLNEAIEKILALFQHSVD